MRYLTLVAIGDPNSKKTELLIKYTGNYKSRRYEEYVNSRFQNNIQNIIVDKIRYGIHFVDTECDDDYEILRRNAIEKADCILLCYSVKSKETFENISNKWCLEVRRFAPFTPVILIGTEVETRANKDNIGVSVDDGDKLKLLIGAYAFIECSIEKFLGIDDIFIEAVRSVYGKSRS